MCFELRRTSSHYPRRQQPRTPDQTPDRLQTGQEESLVVQRPTPPSSPRDTSPGALDEESDSDAARYAQCRSQTRRLRTTASPHPESSKHTAQTPVCRSAHPSLKSSRLQIPPDATHLYPGQLRILPISAFRASGFHL